MSDIKELVRLAVDSHNGNLQKYSNAEAQDTLRQALIEANGGSTKLDIRKLRDGKYSQVFAIIEEILRVTIPGGFQENDLFTALVDYRNIAEGDLQTFQVEDSSLFFFDKVADGTQGIRRQRFPGVKEVTINPVPRAVRIYEELNRVLAGRVDFNTLIDRVNESVKQEVLGEIYSLWNNASSTDLGGAVYYPVVGSFSEDNLLDVIAHVEAAAGGKTATIIGTKKAIKKAAINITSSYIGNDYKRDMYENGFIGKYFGSPVVAMPQRHKYNQTSFAFEDDLLTIVAGDDKPIKFVYEGDPLIIMGEPTSNADLTQEYFLLEKWGMGIVMASNSGIGKYEFT